MSLKQFAVAFGASAFIATAAINAQAFNLNSVKSAAGLGSSAQTTSVVDVAGLTNQQQALMAQFTSAMQNMLMAQSKTLEAAGHREQADLAKATAANYASGNIDDPKAIERDRQLTEENQAQINQMLAENQAISEEGKAALAEAVPFYAQGMLDGSQLPGAFQSWTTDAKNGANSLASDPMQAQKLVSSLSEVTTVTTNLPGLVSSWTSTTKSFLTFAKSNDVDVSDVESKLGDL